MLGAGMKVTEKNSTIACGNTGIRFRFGAQTRKFLRRHDQEKLMIRFRKNDEFFGAITAPARGYGDAIFFIAGGAEFAGVESLGWRRRGHVRVENSTILAHFPPPLTTSRAAGQHYFQVFCRVPTSASKAALTPWSSSATDD